MIQTMNNLNRIINQNRNKVGFYWISRQFIIYPLIFFVYRKYKKSYQLTGQSWLK
jgi:hypothetical protein